MMWMMGYNDAGEFNTIQDPFTGRKLRPLMPRPARDHFVAAMVEQDKTQQQVVVTSRWNPTPEQLQTLEELYQRGTRTPTADQIQQITSQLRRYGKIEGKNVFYWFQNHKARERQKRRRRLQPNNNNNETEKGLQESEAQGTAFEVEKAKKNWASPTNYSSAISVKTTQGATKGADQAECESDGGWVHFDIDDAAAQILSHKQRRRRNATWQMHKRPHDNFINIFDFEPYFNPQHLHRHEEEAQTLQLFPVESIYEERAQEDEEAATMSSSSASDPVTTKYRFFEFLPLKN